MKEFFVHVKLVLLYLQKNFANKTQPIIQTKETFKPAFGI